jgi:hypothetical protein
MLKRQQLSENEIPAITDLSGIICLKPFYLMEFTTSGKVYTCCPSWIKFPIGDIRKNTIDGIWNSLPARFIRRKMYRGEWTDICNPICPRISEYRHDNKVIFPEYFDRFDIIPPGLIDEIKNRRDFLKTPPAAFNLSNSQICNLSCIMCDRATQSDSPGLIEKTAREIEAHLPRTKKLLLTGMGDPLARPDTRRLLMNTDTRYHDIGFDLITNGLLLTKYWEKIKHQKFGNLLLSVDAASRETYEKIRIGGSWETLLESLACMRENRDRFSCITMNMTVMRHNYGEIPQFIDLAESFGFHVSFQRIRGRCGDQNFFEMPDAAAVNTLDRIVQEEKARSRDIVIFWGDLSETNHSIMYPVDVRKGFYGHMKDRLLPEQTRRRAAARATYHAVMNNMKFLKTFLFTTSKNKTS